MREVKRDFPWFSITEYEKEAAYLRRRHKFIYWQTAGGKKNRSSHKCRFPGYKQIFHSSSGNFTIPKLLLEFIFSFSVTAIYRVMIQFYMMWEIRHLLCLPVR